MAVAVAVAEQLAGGSWQSAEYSCSGSSRTVGRRLSAVGGWQWAVGSQENTEYSCSGSGSGRTGGSRQEAVGRRQSAVGSLVNTELECRIKWQWLSSAKATEDEKQLAVGSQENTVAMAV